MFSCYLLPLSLAACPKQTSYTQLSLHTESDLSKGPLCSLPLQPHILQKAKWPLSVSETPTGFPCPSHCEAHGLFSLLHKEPGNACALGFVPAHLWMASTQPSLVYLPLLVSCYLTRAPIFYVHEDRTPCDLLHTGRSISEHPVRQPQHCTLTLIPCTARAAACDGTLLSAQPSRGRHRWELEANLI